MSHRPSQLSRTGADIPMEVLSEDSSKGAMTSLSTTASSSLSPSTSGGEVRPVSTSDSTGDTQLSGSSRTPSASDDTPAEESMGRVCAGGEDAGARPRPTPWIAPPLVRRAPVEAPNRRRRRGGARDFFRALRHSFPLGLPRRARYPLHVQRGAGGVASNAIARRGGRLLPPLPLPSPQLCRWRLHVACLLGALGMFYASFLDAWSAYEPVARIYWNDRGSLLNNSAAYFHGKYSSVDAAARGVALSSEKYGYALYSGMVALSAILGAVTAGKVADTVGRRPLLLGAPVPAIFAWIILIYANSTAPVGDNSRANVLWWLLARFFLGLTQGAITAVLPVFVIESAHPARRGAAGAWMGACAIAGAPMCVLLRALWPLGMRLAIGLTPAAIWAAYFFLPETPDFLARRGRLVEALASRRMLWGPLTDPGIETDRLKPLALERVSAEEPDSDLSMNSNCRGKNSWRLVARLSASLMGFMPIVMVAPVNLFVVFVAAEDMRSAETGYVATSAVLQLVCVLIAALLADMAGRRLLLVVATSGVAVVYFCLSLFHGFVTEIRETSEDKWVIMEMALLTTLLMARGLGADAVAWTAAVEVLAVHSGRQPDGNGRCQTTGRVTSILSAATALTVAAFPMTRAYLGPSVAYGMPAAVSALATTAVKRALPETRRRPLEELLEEEKPVCNGTTP